MDNKNALKQERLNECNLLIEKISTHGRMFFNYQKQHGRTSRLELGFQGRVYFIDGYTGKRIYTHRRYCRWDGFTEGGTLKGWVEAMRDHITFGTKLNINAICPKGIGRNDGNIWGYEELEAEKLRESVKHLEMFNKTDQLRGK